jgi:hypothetical protein
VSIHSAAAATTTIDIISKLTQTVTLYIVFGRCPVIILAGTPTALTEAVLLSSGPSRNML